MSFATKRAVIVRWVNLITRYPVESVIWADQNMPRPEKPYVALKMSAFNTVNREYVHDVDINGKANISTHKEFTLSIHCFGTSSVDPMEKMLNLHDSMNKSNVIQMLEQEGIAIIDDLMGPTDTSIKLDTTYERRASMDLLCRMPWTVDDTEVGLISSIAAEGISIDAAGITIGTSLVTIGASFIPTDITLDNYEFMSIDELLSAIHVKSGATELDLTYYEDTVVTIDATPAEIIDLEEGDELDMVYFMYSGLKTLKTVTAIRPI